MAYNKLVQSKFMLCISSDDYFQKGNIYDVGTIVDKIARKGNLDLNFFDFEDNLDIIKDCQENGYPLFIELDEDLFPIVNISVNMDKYSELMHSVNNLTFRGYVCER